MPTVCDSVSNRARVPEGSQGTDRPVSGHSAALALEPFHARCLPEDGMWSMDFASRGLKVVATTRVPVRHYGHTAFAIGFGAPWGQSNPDEWEPI